MSLIIRFTSPSSCPHVIDPLTSRTLAQKLTSRNGGWQNKHRMAKGSCLREPGNGDHHTSRYMPRLRSPGRHFTIRLPKSQGRHPSWWLGLSARTGRNAVTRWESPTLANHSPDRSYSSARTRESCSEPSSMVVLSMSLLSRTLSHRLLNSCTFSPIRTPESLYKI